MSIRVAFIAAECEPWAKTGGLADVVDALARALGALPGDDLETPIDVFLPRYRGMDVPADRILGRRTIRVAKPGSRAGTRTAVDVVDVRADGYRLRLIDHPASFDRAGGYYGDASGDFADNAARFAVLCRAALEVMRVEGREPDLLHLHDWHAAPTVRYLGRPAGTVPGSAGAPATLLTVHNLAYHGWTSPDHVAELGPEWDNHNPSAGPL